MESESKRKATEDTETIYDQKVKEALLKRLTSLLERYKISELTELNNWTSGTIEFRIKLETK